MLNRAYLEGFIPEEGNNSFDVIVVGGGVAGVAAAVMSARSGAKTLILEASPSFGGVNQTALWMPVDRLFKYGDESRGGFHEMFVRKIKAFGHDASAPGMQYRVTFDNLDVHPDYVRLAYLELLEEAGASYLLYSAVTEAIMDGNTIKGVVTNGKHGRHEYFGKIVVDASGDGAVATIAGAEMLRGNGKGLFMHTALLFAIGGCDTEKFLKYYPQDFRRLPASEEEARKMKFAPETPSDFYYLLESAGSEGYVLSSWFAIHPTSLPGVFNCNHGGPRTMGTIDATDLRQATLSERFNARVPVDFIRFARDKRLPGLENCWLLRTGAGISIRETRRIVGEYVYTGQDSIDSTRFDDAVAITYDAVRDGGGAIGFGVMSAHYGNQFPYRGLLPKKVENLLVAGRCVSADLEGIAATRGMGSCMAFGQAAGVAASLAARQGIKARDVDAALVREGLSAYGVDVEPEDRPRW